MNKSWQETGNWGEGFNAHDRKKLVFLLNKELELITKREEKDKSRIRNPETGSARGHWAHDQTPSSQAEEMPLEGPPGRPQQPGQGAQWLHGAQQPHLWGAVLSLRASFQRGCFLSGGCRQGALVPILLPPNFPRPQPGHRKVGRTWGHPDPWVPGGGEPPPLHCLNTSPCLLSQRIKICNKKM